MTRLTSFVLLVTLAGTPAAAATCAAMCLTGAFHHSMSAPAAAHGNHDSARLAASHEHDESEEAQAASASAAMSMEDAGAMPRRVSASEHECCSAADKAIQARDPGQRTDVSTALSMSAAALTRAASIPAFVSLPPPQDFDPPGTYTPRSHAPLVLRI